MLLEAESIYVLREVAAEFSRPGHAVFHWKGFLRNARLAQKAFYPAQIPSRWFISTLRINSGR